MSVGTFETEHSVAVNHGNKSLFVIREANPVYNFHSHGTKPHIRGYLGAEQNTCKALYMPTNGPRCLVCCPARGENPGLAICGLVSQGWFPYL